MANLKASMAMAPISAGEHTEVFAEVLRILSRLDLGLLPFPVLAPFPGGMQESTYPKAHELTIPLEAI